jgi:hypothetical protein
MLITIHSPVSWAWGGFRKHLVSLAEAHVDLAGKGAVGSFCKPEGPRGPLEREDQRGWTICKETQALVAS